MTKAKETKQEETKTEETKAEAPVKKEQTVADKIWAELKGQPLEMFGLPLQTVADWCSPQVVDPTKLYVVIKVGAVLQALVDRFGWKYDIEMVNKWVVIAPKQATK
jgi:hypothetical protein